MLADFFASRVYCCFSPSLFCLSAEMPCSYSAPKLCWRTGLFWPWGVVPACATLQVCWCPCEGQPWPSILWTISLHFQVWPRHTRAFYPSSRPLMEMRRKHAIWETDAGFIYAEFTIEVEEEICYTMFGKGLWHRHVIQTDVNGTGLQRAKYFLH